MKTLINMTTHSNDKNRFAGNADLKAYYRGFGLDGIELLASGEDEEKLFAPEDIVGVHLVYFATWMDLWMQDRDRLLREFGDEEAVTRSLGGMNREDLVGRYLTNLEFANRYSPEYLVFHVSECTLEEAFKRTYRYSDEEVVDAAAELANAIVPHIQGNPYLLFENLWYSGLTLRRPEIAARLLDKVNYGKKGLLLDTGHLMHTNTELTNLDEAADFILQVVDVLGSSQIKGVHLHQTLSGAKARELKETWTDGGGDYHTRLMAAMPHIHSIDSHFPYDSPRARDIVEAIDPEYLVLEQLSSDRATHEKNIARQLDALKPQD